MGDTDTNETLSFLQEKGDVYTKLSTVERKRLAELEEALEHVHDETNKYRTLAKSAAVDVLNLHVQTPNPAYTKADGNDVGRQAMLITKKVLHGLEAKLNKLLQRKSEIISENRSSKLEINHMRRMRQQTEIAQAKYEATLLEIKANIEAMAAESSTIVSERDRLVKEKEKLERLNVEEQKTFSEQHEAMCLFIQQQNESLEVALMNERKFDKNPTADLQLMNDESDSNCSKAEAEAKTPVGRVSTALKAVAPATVKESKSLVTILGGFSHKNDKAEEFPLTLEEEIDMAKKVNQYAELIRDEQKSLSSVQEKISNYELMFAQLQKMTECETLDEIVATYVSRDDEMFSLYNYMQTLSNETDQVNEQRDQIKREKIAYEKLQSDQASMRLLQAEDLRAKHDALLESLQEVEDKSRTEHQYLVQVCKKIDNLFFKLDCDRPENQPCFIPNLESNRPQETSFQSGRKSNTMSGSELNQSSRSLEGSLSSPPPPLPPFTLVKTPSTKFAEKQVAVLLGEGVSESNVVDYLGCIESRAVNIVEQYTKLSDNKPYFTTASSRATSRATSCVSRKALSAGHTLRKSISLRRFSSSGGIYTPASWLVNSQKPLTGGSVNHTLSQSGTSSPPRVMNIDEINEFEHSIMSQTDNDDHIVNTRSAHGNHSYDVRAVHSHSVSADDLFRSPGLASHMIHGDSNSTIRSDEPSTPVNLLQFKERLFKSLQARPQSQTASRELPMLPSHQLSPNKSRSNNNANGASVATTKTK